MGDSFLTLGLPWRCPDAVELLITHGPENTLHRRLPTPFLFTVRALRAVRGQPQDRLQVDRALRSRRSAWAQGSFAPSACLPSPNSDDGGGGAPGLPAPAPHL